jgi:hypothetical protein
MNITPFKSRLHSDNIAEAIIARQEEHHKLITAARIAAKWDFKEGDNANPYPKCSIAYTAYEDEFYSIWLEGNYAENGGGE